VLGATAGDGELVRAGFDRHVRAALTTDPDPVAAKAASSRIACQIRSIRPVFCRGTSGIQSWTYAVATRSSTSSGVTSGDSISRSVTTPP
jgi:hypothetical protein